MYEPCNPVTVAPVLRKTRGWLVSSERATKYMGTRKKNCRLVTLVDAQTKSFLQTQAVKTGESVGVIVRNYLQLGIYAEKDGERRYRIERADEKALGV